MTLTANESGKQRKLRIRKQLLQVLQTRCKKVFDLKKPKPLKVGIKEDFAKEFPDLTEKDLKTFFNFWCGRKPYLESIQKSKNRYDLNGKVAGLVSVLDKTEARARLEIREHRKSKRLPK